MAPLDNPETAPCCELSFCGKCISAALQVKSECPNCRGALTESTLVEPRQSLVSMIKRLKVQCPSQCGWSGERALVNDHLMVCSERIVVTPLPPSGSAAPLPATPADIPCRAGAPPAAVAPTIPAATTPATPAAIPAAAVPAAAATAPVVAVPTSTPRAVALQPLEVTLTPLNYHPTVHVSETILPFYTMAHIVAPAASQATAERKGLQISAVMDISGSMGQDKMRMAKEALNFVIRELKPSDRFGLIAFDDKVESRLPLTDMTSAGRDLAANAIGSLKSRGGTNLSSGLFAGIAQARDMPFVTARAARHVDVAQDSFSGNSSARPSAAVPTNLMSRVLSSFGSRSTSKPQPLPPRPVEVAPAPGDEYFTDATATSAAPYCEPLTLTIKYNTAECKRDGAWLTRYTFELVTPLPAKYVQYVSVRHPTHGKITLRGSTTFGLLPSGVTGFIADVTYASAFAHVESIPLTLTPDEDGLGTVLLETPAVGTPSINRSRIVMLFTDGQANEGITDPAQLTARTAAVLAKMPEKDVTVVTFGFGADHNAALLSSIAEKSQGTYYFVENTGMLKQIFADCIGGLLSIVASELSLTIRPSLGVRVSEVMTLYPYVPHPTDGSYVVKMKDLYAEEQRDVVVKLDVAQRNECPAMPLVTWELTYSSSSTPPSNTKVTAASLVATVGTPFVGTPDAMVDEQINRFRAAQAMADAQRLAEEGRVGEANARLRSAAAAVQTSTSAGTPYSVMLQGDLDRCVRATATPHAWQHEGQKQVSQMKTTHAQQRCNYVAENEDDDESCAYVTSAKVAMRRNARR